MSSVGPFWGDKPRRQYSFGDFTLDLDAGVLRRGAEEVPLRPKPFAVLAYLVERHGRLVTKTALIEAVWPDAVVTDNSLVQCLREIRRALDDDSQQLIRTAARRGYVFAAPLNTPVVELPRQPDDPGPVAVPQAPAPRNPLGLKALMGTAALLAVAAGFLAIRTHPERRDLTYSQITNFTDSAVAPALSPDGRMLAFFRSDRWWLTRDQIYVKLLPNGEPFQLTNDPRQKYGLAFSPDGSRVSYSVVPGWDTFTVPLPGGEPKLLLANAAGLTWLDERRVLFSEIRTGFHMGVVTATENRSEYRKIYFPQDERGMAHFSYPSPDRKWLLVVEMNPVWQPCRLVPLDGSSSGRQVGPAGKCTSTAWSPDGKWMYFSAEVSGNQHLWRQRFPAGEPEQITSGPDEEDGIAVAPDGRSLITSIGMRQGAVWIHDADGDRPISSNGDVITTNASGLFGAQPTFSRDGKLLYYLRRESPGSPIELWRADVASGKSESVTPGFSILEYDISADGLEALFSTQSSGKPSQLWVAALNRNSPPRLIASSGESSPHFGPDGKILFRLTEGKSHYLAQMSLDGSGRSKVVDYPIGNIVSISPDRRWLVAYAPPPDGRRGGATIAVPVAAGAPRRISANTHPTVWAPDGRFLYVTVEWTSNTSTGKTVAIPIAAGETFPVLPPSGIEGLEDGSALSGALVIDASYVSPGPDPSVFAYIKTTVHRNLFRIPL